MTTKRCTWVNMGDPLMLQYHDREWGVSVDDDRKHFEFLVLEAAQAGFSWSIVLGCIRPTRKFRDGRPPLLLWVDEALRWPAASTNEV